MTPEEVDHLDEVERDNLFRWSASVSTGEKVKVEILKEHIRKSNLIASKEDNCSVGVEIAPRQVFNLSKFDKKRCVGNKSI